MHQIKKALVLTHRNIDTGPRMFWEKKMLDENFNVTVIGSSKKYSNKILSFKKFYTTWQRVTNWLFRKLFFLQLFNGIGENYFAIRKFILQEKFDLIIIHEINLLPMLARLKKIYNFKIVFNAHEYHPLEFEDKANWLATHGRYNYELYKKYIKDVDLLVNICDMIANKCEDEFQKKSIIVPNVTQYFELEPNSINDGVIKMIHHGGAMPSRKLENMIDTAVHLGDKYQLDLMLTNSDESYYEKLQQLCAKTTNVKLIKPVPFLEIVPTLNKYDIGIVLVPPVNFNYKAGLGNKFFEFIQARLCLAIGPLPEMKSYVDKYKLGVVSNTFDAKDLANEISKLSKESIFAFKSNAHDAASIIHTAPIYKMYESELLKIMN